MDRDRGLRCPDLEQCEVALGEESGDGIITKVEDAEEVVAEHQGDAHDARQRDPDGSGLSKLTVTHGIADDDGPPMLDDLVDDGVGHPTEVGLVVDEIVRGRQLALAIPEHDDEPFLGPCEILPQ